MTARKRRKQCETCRNKLHDGCSTTKDGWQEFEGATTIRCRHCRPSKCPTVPQVVDPHMMADDKPEPRPSYAPVFADQSGRLYVKDGRDMREIITVRGTDTGECTVKGPWTATAEMPQPDDEDGWTYHEPGTLLSFGPHREYESARHEGDLWTASESADRGGPPSTGYAYRSRPKPAPGAWEPTEEDCQTVHRARWPGTGGGSELGAQLAIGWLAAWRKVAAERGKKL